MPLLNPVFIHGWAFSSKVFGKLPGIKVELPGHGKNEGRYESLLRTAQDIALSLPGIHDLIGWSLGGSIALLIASLFPDKVRRLFLIGTSPTSEERGKKRTLRAFKLRVKREGVEVFRSMAYHHRFEDRLSLHGCLQDA
ncbi:MAG: alpha/beta fold hydrolase [Aquificota bacterium]|nr:alpha/beta fold hydrolase [Aquificota bacterium]